MTRFYARLVIALLVVNAIAQLAMATKVFPATGQDDGGKTPAPLEWIEGVGRRTKQRGPIGRMSNALPDAVDNRHARVKAEDVTAGETAPMGGAVGAAAAEAREAIAARGGSIPSPLSAKMANVGNPAKRGKSPHLSNAVALARVWVSESGWDSPADQRGIYEVLAARAKSHRPSRIIAMAKRYSSCTFPPHENPHRGRCPEQRTWVSELTATCAKPMSLDVSEALWRQFYRQKCKQLIKRAERMLAMELDDGCVASAPVHHWGGPMDDHRAERAGWVRVRVTCGLDEPRNSFWCVPRRESCGGANA